MDVSAFVGELASARIGETFNQYSRSRLRRERLAAYLESRRNAGFLLVGEAAGYRGARVSGIPFTSERQLTGSGPAEATATIVHRVLGELELEDRVLLWNVVPTHPGTETSNRPPTRDEIDAGIRFLGPLAAGRLVVAVGRVAEHALGVPGIRHPSHGGAESFRSGLASRTRKDRRSTGAEYVDAIRGRDSNEVCVASASTARRDRAPSRRGSPHDEREAVPDARRPSSGVQPHER